MTGKLPVGADPLLDNGKATLKPNDNFRRSVGKAGKVDDSEKENCIS